MNPQDAKLVSDFLLATLETEIPTTTNVFRALPSDRLDYRPDPVSKTALGLMRHIALEDVWFLKAVADGTFAAIPDDSDECGVMTPADAVAFYNDHMPAVISRIRTMSGEALLQEVDLFGMMKLPALQFLSMALRHSTHHRGQLTAYLRAMGGKVPSVYGPSADTPLMAAKA